MSSVEVIFEGVVTERHA